MRNIKDYLHFYLGCEAFWQEEGRKSTYSRAIDYDMLQNSDWIKPILRPLSDMDKTEEMLLGLSGSKWGPYTAADIIILLKEGFDLFGLIKYGLAINKTSL